MQEIEGHLSVLGPFEWRDPEADPADFIVRMRNLMVDELAAVRGGEVHPATGPALAPAPDAAPTQDPDVDPAPAPAPA